MKNLFFILNGNNAATYIINTTNWRSISKSLEFYQARSVKAKFLKTGLLIYLGFGKYFLTKKLKSILDCEQFLQDATISKVNFELDNTCSILISPTRDKVIVHHHDAYFQKFAFGKSYPKVKNEVSIFALFQQGPVSFQISRFSDFKDLANECLSFKLSNVAVDKKSKQSYSLDLALSEFFTVTKVKDSLLSVDLEKQLKQLHHLNKPTLKTLENHLHTLISNNENTILPRGLVHNDFKPWNIKNYDKILIFDFEEARVDGLPMMDLFNYYCDPIIRYQSPEIVFNALMNSEKKKLYNAYKKHLGINISTKLMFDVYLIERIIFWVKAKKHLTVEAYLGLFHFIHPNA